MRKVLGRERLVALLCAAAAVTAAPSRAETVLITGSNSGIGLEFARQYAALGWDVVATHRRDSPPETLRTLSDDFANVRVERMDVTSEEQVETLAAKLEGTAIDVLINNAGVYQLGGTYDNQLFGQLDFEAFDVFAATNIKGPMMVTEAFIDHVRAGRQKKIVSISSSHGAVTVPPLVEGAFWYGMSKAALNKAMATLSHVLDEEEIVVVVLHPGAVLTEKQAHLDFPGMIETTFSVEHMIDTIAGLTLEDTGKFLQYDGTPQPW